VGGPRAPKSSACIEPAIAGPKWIAGMDARFAIKRPVPEWLQTAKRAERSRESRNLLRISMTGTTLVQISFGS